MTFQSSKEKEPVGARFNAPVPPQGNAPATPQDAVPPSFAFAGARLDAPAPPQVVKMKFPGAAAHPRISGESPLPGKVNYFVGKDRSKWRANVPTYGRVRYDLVVAPGADPETIRLAFELPSE